MEGSEIRDSDLADEDFYFDKDMTSHKSSKNILTVHNVLASGSFACNARLNLDRCCKILGNSYYSPSEFPALRIDVRSPLSVVFTISLFESGRIQATGGCRPIEAKRAMMKIGKRLRRALNYSITFHNFEIQNILAVYDMGFSISLARFVQAYNGHAYYEPDRFPAVRVRIAVPDAFAKDVKSSLTPNKRSVETVNQEMSADDKIRKILIGDVSNGVHDTFSERVGSYMISEYAKRPLLKSRIDKNIRSEIVTANLFSTGKLTFTGAKSIRSLNYTLKEIKPVIEQLPLEMVFLRDCSMTTDVQIESHSTELENRIRQLQEESNESEL